MPRGRRVVYFDILNIVATLGVIAMHFNGLTFAWSTTLSWRQALFVDCLFYPAVPIFFMLTGATLLDYRRRYDTKTFAVKRVKRVLVPFLTWTAIAWTWKAATGQISPPENALDLVNRILDNEVMPLYWFFIPLFSVYLSLPLLSLAARHRKTLAYSLVVAVALGIAAPNICKYVGIHWNSDLSVLSLSGYLVYVVAGYLLKDCDIKKGWRIAAYALGLAGLIFHFALTVSESDAAHELTRSAGGYLNLPCFFMAIAAFVFMKQIHWERLFKSEASQKSLASIAGCSFGIYLTHMFVYYYISLIFGLGISDWEFRLLCPIIAYLVCLAFVWTAKKVPGLRCLLP